MIYKNIFGYEFQYDTEEDILYRKSKKTKKLFNCFKLVPNKDGYTGIGLTIDKKLKHFKLHRIVYMMFNDFEYHDPLIIDHRDRKNPKNNSIANLKAVTREQNNQNTNSIGVSKQILKNKNGKVFIYWKSSFYLDGKKIQKSFKSRNFAVWWRNIKINQHYYLGK